MCVYDMSVYQIQITNFSFVVIVIMPWAFLWIVIFDDQAKIFTCFSCVVYVTWFDKKPHIYCTVQISNGITFLAGESVITV